MFGVTGKVAYTGVVTGVNYVTGFEVTDNFQVADLKNGVGRVKGQAATNRSFDAVVKMIPVDENGALATAKSNIKWPAPLGVITVTEFGTDTLDGTYNYQGGGKLVTTPEGYIEQQLPCKRHGDTSATAAAFAPIT